MSDESEAEGTVLICGHYRYQDEPLATSNEDDDSQNEEGEIDEDGLSPAVLEARYLKEIAVEVW